LSHRLVGLVVLLAGLSACGTTRVVRVETGEGQSTVHVPRGGDKPVVLKEKEFKRGWEEQARQVRPAEYPLEEARRLFLYPSLKKPYAHARGSLGLMSVGGDAPPRARLLPEVTPEQEALKNRYLMWCTRTWGAGDCLRLLMDKPYLDEDGKYTLAMAIAQGSVLESMKSSFGEMVEPQAVVASIASAAAMYMLLWALPEPVSKGLAAALTVAMIAYVGVETVWQLIDGWLVLMREVERATTFDEIHASGEKYGGVLGENATRAFVLLATAAVGSTAPGLAAKLPKLPGAGQAAVLVEAQTGMRVVAVAEVESVALTAEGFTIALAPGAVAMAAQGLSGGGRWNPPKGGPGQWVVDTSSMSERARDYQAKMTGAPPGYAYRVKVGDEEVDFDGFHKGELLEIKGEGYAQFIDDKLNVAPYYEGIEKMLAQADRQYRIAQGRLIRWIVAEERLKALLQKQFELLGFNIKVVCIPPTP
jgi:hypothetical protein